KFLKMGIADFFERHDAYANEKDIELDDEPTEEKMSQAEEEAVLAKETNRIKAKLDASRKVIILAIEGKLISSEDMASTLDNYATYGNSKVSFIIGGSLGLHPTIKEQADLSISFGRITLPH